MRHLWLPLYGFLLLIAAWLGVAVWQQRVERDAWAVRAADATRRNEQRKARAKAAVRRMPAGVRPSAAASPAATKLPAEIEAGRQGAAFVARQERMNALSGYHTGFIALQLPAPIVARAKEIILGAWQAAADARKSAANPAAGMAASHAVIDAMNEQLVTLLAEKTYAELKAYQVQRHFDWTIGTDLWDAGVPLSSEQLHGVCLAIVQTKYQESDRTFQPTERVTPDPATGLSPQDDALLAACAGVLSPEQTHALRENLIDDNRYSAAMRGFAERQRQLWQQAGREK